MHEFFIEDVTDLDPSNAVLKFTCFDHDTFGKDLCVNMVPIHVGAVIGKLHGYYSMGTFTVDLREIWKQISGQEPGQNNYSVEKLFDLKPEKAKQVVSGPIKPRMVAVC